VSRLDELKVTYKISDEGTTVLVPAKIVYKTRIQLANEGLPKGGTVGFSDILERQNLAQRTGRDKSNIYTPFKVNLPGL